MRPARARRRCFSSVRICSHSTSESLLSPLSRALTHTCVGRSLLSSRDVIAAQMTVGEMFDIIRDLPLAGVLNTNVDVEGQKKGIDERQARDFISRCPCDVISSGGVTSRMDADILADAGAVGAVVGLALYTEVIKPWEWDTPWMA